jgi:hypothetical protein
MYNISLMMESMGLSSSADSKKMRTSVSWRLRYFMSVMCLVGLFLCLSAMFGQFHEVHKIKQRRSSVTGAMRKVIDSESKTQQHVGFRCV